MPSTYRILDGNTGGVFALRTPEDLLEKLKRDYSRMKRNPADSDAAFDFFVTALHMKDWMKSSGRTITPSPGYEEALWDVCEHIGNGSKHFTIDRHNAIKSTRHEGGAFDPHSSQPDAFQVGTLPLELEDAHAKFLGKIIEASSLAEKLLVYWSSKFK